MIMLILMVVVSVPVLGSLVLWMISEQYMRYLHNKPDPTKEEWKIKR